MKNNYILFSLFITSFIKSAPLVQAIVNKSQIGFEIVSYMDTVSDCSLPLFSRIIKPNSIFNHEFLLKNDQSILIFRPLYYFDNATNKKILFSDKHGVLNEHGIEQAYTLWKAVGYKRKFLNAHDWFRRWIGGDIRIEPHTSQVLGYLINLSRTYISNNIGKDGIWLSFAQGIFARLVLEIDIIQHDRKGILSRLKVIAGEGGICRHGVVERL